MLQGRPTPEAKQRASPTCINEMQVEIAEKPAILAGEFMLARYREVVEIVLHFRESKEKQIQRAVISLIPRLAAFAPERFAATYLNTCVDYLINIVKYAHHRQTNGCARCCDLSGPSVAFLQSGSIMRHSSRALYFSQYAECLHTT